jgi:DNA-binding LacI/PurR family transcriptional regulator
MSVAAVKNKSDQVRDILLNELKRGKYKVGCRVDSDNVLSRNLGISKNTVREAVSTLVNEGYFKRIQGKGTFVISTSPSVQANSLKIIRLVCRDTYKAGDSDLFINSVLSGIHLGGANYNYGICVDLFTEDTPAKLLNSKSFREAPKDGVILAGFSIDSNDIAPLLEEDVPVVSVGKPNDESLIPYVDADHASAVSKAVKYLFENGHKKIALLEKNLHVPSHNERLRGYIAAHLEANLKVESSLIYLADNAKISGDAAVRELRKRKADFSAVITYGDDMLHGAIKQFNQEKRVIPDDVSIITYSTYSLPLLNLMGLNPTRIQDDMSAFGAAAVELLNEIAEKKSTRRSIILKPDFIIGNTVKNMEKELVES